MSAMNSGESVKDVGRLFSGRIALTAPMISESRGSCGGRGESPG